MSRRIIRCRVMDMGLQGARVLVTGASEGIGFEAARILRDEGAVVAIASRNPAAAAERIGATAVSGDLSRPGAGERAVAEAADAVGKAVRDGAGGMRHVLRVYRRGSGRTRPQSCQMITGTVPPSALHAAPVT